MVWCSVGTIVLRRLGMRAGRPQRAHRVLDESLQKEGQWKISKARTRLDAELAGHVR